ncbi:MAG: YtxH domain-containing protein [Rectinemataceae bacterium]|nr:YtxH domain-containing protein [Rectinemataceae bacterium]
MSFNDVLDSINKRKRTEERNRTMVKFALGMGLAATIGLVKGILYAPKSGKETREDLKKKASETVDTIREKVLNGARALKIAKEKVAEELHEVVKAEKAPTRKKK